MTSMCSLIPSADSLFPISQVLQERRARCETQNTDPVVWTNQRVLKWVRDIDLKVRGDGGGGRGLILQPVQMTCKSMSTLM